MKILIVILALTLGAPVSSPAQKTEDLVEAAKEAKKKRKEPATKVLTNKDVKNSKGNLIALPETKTSPDEKKKAGGPTPLQQHDANYRDRLALEEKVSAASAVVAELERALAALESQYYEENDPDRRDKVIRKEFEETRKKLETARAELDRLSPEPRTPSPEP